MNWLKQLFGKKFAVMPPVPEDCLLVLAITPQGRISGWQTPDSARKGGMRYKHGATFVMLSQKDIDCFIPPHSPDVDEETAEMREYEERKLIAQER